jgi:hypothetical protein
VDESINEAGRRRPGMPPLISHGGDSRFQKQVRTREKRRSLSAVRHAKEARMTYIMYIRQLMIVLFLGLGVTLFFVPGGFMGGYSLLKGAVEGFKFEQRLAKEEQDFQHDLLRRDQAEQERQAEHERQLQILRLQRPATPDESY